MLPHISMPFAMLSTAEFARSATVYEAPPQLTEGTQIRGDLEPIESTPRSPAPTKMLAASRNHLREPRRTPAGVIPLPAIAQAQSVVPQALQGHRRSMQRRKCCPLLIRARWVLC